MCIDVKPENLLLCSDGKVILSDFGIAKILPDIERCQSTSGTHGYMVSTIYENKYSRYDEKFSTGTRSLHR